MTQLIGIYRCVDAMCKLQHPLDSSKRLMRQKRAKTANMLIAYHQFDLLCFRLFAYGIVHSDRMQHRDCATFTS